MQDHGKEGGGKKGRLTLQPYRLSNLDLVTESLTLMAGNSRVLLFSICREHTGKVT